MNIQHVGVELIDYNRVVRVTIEFKNNNQNVYGATSFLDKLDKMKEDLMRLSPPSP